MTDNHPITPPPELGGDGPAVSNDREPASVMDQLNYQLYRRAKILFVRKVIDQAIRDTASVQWRVADTGEQLVRASDLLAWAEHVEKQMERWSSSMTDILRYEEILDIATRVVAHPHTALTAHDKHRAIALIRFLSSDDALYKYIASQMTEDDFKAVQQIRNSIND